MFLRCELDVGLVKIRQQQFYNSCSSPARFESTNIKEDPGNRYVISFTIYPLRVKLYSRWKFHPFDQYECLREDMDYGVFLSCCSTDNLPRGNEIRVQLEQRGYRVCYPHRDFIAGEAVYHNICNGVCAQQTHSLFSHRELPSKVCFVSFLWISMCINIFFCVFWFKCELQFSKLERRLNIGLYIIHAN